MRHLTRWVFLLTLSTLVALVAPAAAPIHAAPAGQQGTAPSTPEALPQSEVVVIEKLGRIRVDSPVANQLNRWNSGSDIGWTNIAAGNFDGKLTGYKQIVAVRGSKIKVFRPFPIPSVIMDMTAPGNWLFDLLAVGDFDGDGLDEIAASYYQPGGVLTNIIVYNYVENNPSNWKYDILAPTTNPWGARWGDMQAGNVNGDRIQGRPIDDLVLVRGPGHVLKVFLGTLTPGVFAAPLENTQSGFPYLALAVGTIHTDPGVADEVVTSRSVENGQLNTVLLWRWRSDWSQFEDKTNVDTRYNPQFTSISLADVNGDGHKELLMLRDPIQNKTALKIMNLFNLADSGFEAAIGCSSGCATGAWKTVRGGDLDADGKDETVVLRDDQYRMYDDGAHGYGQIAGVGGSYFINTTTANATSLLVTNLDGGGGTTPILVADPGLIDLGSVDFGVHSPTATLNIVNGGAGNAISWTAQVNDASSAWLHIDQTAGTTPGVIRVWADSVAAGLGDKTGGIVIATSDPTVPVAVPEVQVKLTVTNPGFLVTPANVALYQVNGQAAPTRSLQLVKPSTGMVNWTAVAVEAAAAQDLMAKLADGSAKVTDQGVSVNDEIQAAPAWLSLTPTSGQVGGDTVASIELSVDSTKVAAGVYHAVVVVVADASVPNNVQSVAVTYMLSDTDHRGYFPLIFK